MREALRRRFTRLLAPEDDPSFASRPGLVVIDGGKGQLGAALEGMAEAGVDGIPVVSLAKKREEVFRPGHSEPLLLDEGSAALLVLQHIRDEAHRFAITFHRQKRAARALRSPLDDIPGVGATRKKALLKRFGSLARLRTADVDELRTVPGVGPALARTIHDHLHGADASARKAG
jgi:excinuclease ABC subunit C